MPHQDDNILLQRLKEGDETAFSDIYEKYIRYMVVEASYHLCDPVAAKDMVHDLFTQWWYNRSLHRINFREKVQFKTYLQHCIRNCCIKQNMQNNRLQLSVNVISQTLEEAEHTEPMKVVGLDNRIKRYMEELPEKPKQVLRMVYLEEMERPHILKELGITSKTLRNHLCTGLSLLRKKLSSSL
ncbi:RNA polymerase sigma factor, sigma-70 family [Chitinophaga sp. CF118]|uniref:RNA polymerase sigma factor n=1 Tax=Chitinophaga sp. CF118 TaxID=1884367 RepID=UPI0008ECF15C|nr:sigma-70 family RNA polymerase sigma factor [Chitinophaga sp. CF118]SFE98089.1 RNA polymerase sigma factor, sigma-70 family [Chitinophaga sp. CF118]